MEVEGGLFEKRKGTIRRGKEDKRGLKKGEDEQSRFYIYV
jgi:hypothetical protein